MSAIQFRKRVKKIPHAPRHVEKNDGRIQAAVPKRLEIGVKTLAEQEQTYESEIVRIALEKFFAQNYPSLIDNISSINEAQRG